MEYVISQGILPQALDYAASTSQMHSTLRKQDAITKAFKDYGEENKSGFE